LDQDLVAQQRLRVLIALRLSKIGVKSKVDSSPQMYKHIHTS
jgi:hypothetical protein